MSSEIPLRIFECTLGSSAVVLYNMCASILQSVGDSRSPMKYLIFASLTNVVLDLLFVAVFRWGVASAALATILSQTLSALLAFRKLTHTGHSYRLSWRQVRFHGDMLRQVVYLGIPSGVQNSVISWPTSSSGQHQRLRLGGHGGLRCLQQNRGLCLLPVSCFSMALATFVSQNIGARRYDRVRSGIRFGLLCSPLLAEAIGLGIFVLSPCWLPTSTAARRSSPTAWPTPGPSACSTSSWPSPLLCRHSPGTGRPIIPMAIMLATWCALRIAYITAVTHFIPDIPGDLLGLSADLVPGRPAVCRLPSPAPFPLRCRTGNVQIK